MFLTSTPTSANCINDVVDTHSPSYTKGRVDSQADNQHMMFSLATTPSIYTSAFSDHKHNGAQHNRTSEHHSLPDSGNERDKLHVRCLTKGPQTQSVSWFVPLNGIQREPLRHSVVDLSDEEVGIDDVASSPDSRPMSAKRYRKSRKPGNAPLTEEVESEKSYKHKGELVLCDLENLAPSEASTVLAENMPLMVDKENFHLGSFKLNLSQMKAIISKEVD
uniref:uncharacterized protein LOC120327905 n=1 Tax=Styela clava TaxID=7725 RepID=UPI00193A409A|nr:uncharacterized protein LOC120327905 [Styela clava]XP_039250204.1 uncharacterized protein LOC120327905 [Styela clava]